MKFSVSVIALTFLASICSAQTSQPSQTALEKPDAVAFFKRASQQLAKGHEIQALSDFRKSLEVDPNFTPAQYSIANTYLRLGLLDKAEEQASSCRDSRCLQVKEKVTELRSLLKEGPSSFDDCSFYSNLLAISPKSVEYLKQRAECLLSKGYAIEAINDLSLVVETDPADVDSAAQVAIAYYVLLDQRNQALQILRRCVQFNDESVVCKDVNKKIKAIKKLISVAPPKMNIGEIRKRVHALLKKYGIRWDEGRNGAMIEGLEKSKCHYLAKKQNWDKAAKICAEVRDFDEEFPPAMLVQAHLEFKNGNAQQALELASKIVNEHSDSDIANLARQLHDNILNQRNRPPPQNHQGEPEKDYYKVLGVEPDADAKQIRKSYRELSKKYHPDKYLSLIHI